MATDLYKGFTNPISRETIRCIASTEEAYIIDWTVQPDGYVPYEHIHINQDEVFHVKSGEVRILIEGKEHIVKAGESKTVEKGKPHIAFNNRNEVLHCIVEYKPGLDMFKFHQCIGGLTLDGDFDKTGQTNMNKLGYFTKRMNAQCITRPTKIPYFVFKFGIYFIYILGTLRGWNKFYKKYTES